MRCIRLIFGIVISTLAFCPLARGQQSDYDQGRQNTRSQQEADRDEYSQDQRDRDVNHGDRDEQNERSESRDQRYSDDGQNDRRHDEDSLRQSDYQRAQDRYRRRGSEQETEHGGLGVTIGEDGNSHVRIQRVFYDSPAAEAGLRTNDEILRVDQQAINSTQQLISEIKRKEPGSRVELQIRRNGATRMVTARLESRSEALPNRFTQDRSQSQHGSWGDPNTPHGHDDLMVHVNNLQQQVDRMTRELEELRSMLNDNPSNRDWSNQTEDSYTRN